MKTLKEIEKEVFIWSKHNFSNQPATNPLLGLIEELGEYYEAVSENNRDKIIDALGDTMIYMMDYVGRMGLDFDYNITAKHGTKFILMNILVGKLCHSHLKYIQKIRINESHTENIVEALRMIFTEIFIEAKHLKIDLFLATETVWEEVSNRDWIKFPTNGVDK